MCNFGKTRKRHKSHVVISPKATTTQVSVTVPVALKLAHGVASSPLKVYQEIIKITFPS
jgi:hypothetical protein